MKKFFLIAVCVVCNILCSRAGVVEVDTTVDGGEIPVTVWSQGGIDYMVIDSDLHEVAVIDLMDKVFDKWGYIDPVTIPSKVIHDGVEYSVVSVGRDTFNTSTQVNLPNSIVVIEPYCFNSLGYDTSDIVTFNFPEDLTSVGNDCFNHTRLTEMKLPSHLKSIGDNCFNENESMATLEFGLNVRSIGANSFNGNSLLKQILLPGSLYYIGQDSFCDCETLEYVRLPRFLPFEQGAGVSTLKLFNNCPNIKVIEWESKTPFSPVNSFDSVNKGNCTVIVPDGCKETYEKSDYWRQFNIVEKSQYQASSPQIELPSDEKEAYFTLDGFQIPRPLHIEKGQVYVKVSPKGTQKFVK